MTRSTIRRSSNACRTATRSCWSTACSSCEKGKRIVALKNVTINEPFFVGHFPALPGHARRADDRGAGAGRRPSCRSQTSGSKSDPTQSVYYFVGIDGARFKRPVVPGDQLALEVEHAPVRAASGSSAATAEGRRRRGAEAELMCTLRTVSSNRGLMIHPTAIVHPRARLAAGVEVGPYAVDRRTRRDRRGNDDRRALRGDGPHAHRARQPHLPLHAPSARPRRTRSTRASPRASRSASATRSANTARSTAARPRTAGETTVGSDNWIMAYVPRRPRLRRRQPHRSSPTARQLAGHVHVGDWVILGGFTGIHQFCRSAPTA
jgi:3-hydroxyacyl-[acyl-carrier-protein] dehydratase